MRAAFESSYEELLEEFETHRAAVSAKLGLADLPTDELLARLSTCLTTVSPNYVLLNESRDAFDPLTGERQGRASA
jgi:hypothetical protein